MNPLLYAFTFLQLSIPSINANTPQIPRGDWQGGPIIRREVHPPVPLLEVSHKPSLYTCLPGNYINRVQPCYFHHNLQPSYSVYKYPVYVNI